MFSYHNMPNKDLNVLNVSSNLDLRTYDANTAVTESSKTLKIKSVLSKILIVSIIIIGLITAIAGIVIALTANSIIGIPLIGLGFIVIMLTIAWCLLTLKNSKKGVAATHTDPSSLDDPLLKKHDSGVIFDNKKYICDNLEHILSNSKSIYNSDSPINYSTVIHSRFYTQFHLKGHDNFVYKLNYYPRIKDNNLPSFILNSYQAYSIAKQAINELQLSTLMISDMEHECIVSSKNGLTYDFIKEEQAPGYRLLDEGTAHLLSKDIVKELTTFICKTGASIDWYNILINPDSPGKIYLTDLNIPLESDFNTEAVKIGLFGNNCHRGLINCLVSRDNINIVISNASELLNEPELLNVNLPTIKHRLASLNRYRRLLDRIIRIDYPYLLDKKISSKEFVKCLVVDYDPQNKQLSEDSIIRLDLENGDMFCLPMSNLVDLLKNNPSSCLDSSTHRKFEIPEDVRNYLNTHLLEIMNEDLSLDGVEYLENRSSIYDQKICLFSLKDHPQLVFKVYRDNDRSLANHFANDSYNTSIIVDMIIKEENLDLLLQPKRSLIKIIINDTVYNIVVSQINVLPNQHLNLSNLYKTNNSNIKLFKQLITLLSRKGIRISSYNTLLLDSDSFDNTKKKLLLLDVQSDDKICNLFPYGTISSPSTYGRGIMRLFSSEELFEELLYESIICMKGASIIGKSQLSILEYLNRIKSNIFNELLMYHRAQSFLNNSSIVNQQIKLIDSVPFHVISESGALNINAVASSSSLEQHYFQQRNIASLNMDIAFHDIMNELDIIINRKKDSTDLVLQRTISLDDISNSQVLSAYANVYSSNQDPISWLNKIFQALIANGYA